MLSDIEISKQTKILNIEKIGKKLKLNKDDLELYGKYKAKISDQVIKKVKNNKDGKLILVTAINPTPAGEGKTTMAIGLSMAINKLKKTSIVTLRQPSLGPVFGLKGGATGGGYCQVVPMDDINLHFTGDFHAITSATNLLCAMLDNHIYQGNELNIDKDRICIKRVVDMNDRVLRDITIGQGSEKNGLERKDSFEITVASEIMAIFCLTNDLDELNYKLGEIIIAYDYNNNAIYAKDIKANGAMTVLLKDALKPNLIQTTENTPCIMHGGPFANIAHGCNSIIATELSLKLSDYVVTEAGFGADLGAEKFIDIKCRKGKFKLDAIVLVATIRALKYNGEIDKDKLNIENLEALNKGIINLDRHIDNLKKHNIPLIVTINKFYTDSENEINFVKEYVENKGVKCVISEAFEKGSLGSLDLAKEVINTIENNSKNNNEMKYMYDENLSVEDKVLKLVKEIYGGKDVSYSDTAKEKIKNIVQLKKDKLPICVAKTQSSFSDDKSLLGAPSNYTFKVTDIKLNNGAGFIVIYAGKVLTMPGLPKLTAAEKIGVKNGSVYGIF